MLACARGDPLLDLVRCGIDWTAFCETAAWHGVLPLAYWRLNADCPDEVPSEVTTQLRNAFRETAGRNLLFASELSIVLEMFRRKRIRAVPLKGPALAFGMYENYALREFEDLDILVQRSQAREAMDLLASGGYAPAIQLRGAVAASYINTNYEMVFRRPGGPCPVEIHWGLQEEKFLSAALGPEHWWRRMETIQIAGSAVVIPSRADLLLFLCAHGAKHRWERLKWICDISALIRSSPGLDWSAICEEAADKGVERLLWLGLLLAKQVVNCPLPEKVERSALVEPGIERLAARICRRLYAEPRRAGLFETTIFHLALQKRFGEKLRYVSKNMFVPTAGEWSAVTLPAYLTGLYYVLRPLRLLKDVLGRKQR